MTDQMSTRDSRVLLADRTELFRILHFLDDKLPNSCPIQFFVHCAIVSCNQSYRVYYVKDLQSRQYTAILGIKKEHMTNSQLESTNCLLTVTWDGSDPYEVIRMSDSVTEIDWKRDAFFIFGYHDLRDSIIFKYLEEHHAEVIPDEGSPCSQYYLPSKDAINSRIEMPPEVYVKSLEPMHATMVHRNSMYRTGSTVEDVLEEIELFPSAGVFFKENDELVSWIMCHPPKGMSRLFTLEPYRRKGYATLAVRYLSKIVAQSGCVPFVTVIKGNTPAIALFSYLGFRLFCRRAIYLIPAPTTACNGY